MSHAGRQRVAVVFGGRSVEHEVSIRSARTVMDALDGERFDPVPVGITPEGRWRTGAAAVAMLEGRATAGDAPGDFILLPDPSMGGLAGPATGGGWTQLAVDVVFPVVHGIDGEDGTLQGLLDLAELPYVGSGVAASALGMDKRLQRRLFEQAGLPTLTTVEIRRPRWESEPGPEERRAVDEVGLPCFVKPNRSGSSVGVSRVGTVAELGEAIACAARYDGIVLVETAVDAREIECAVLGNEEAEATGPGEIVPQGEFYDYRAKYIDDTAELRVPAPVDPACAEQVRGLATAAFASLGCSGLARVDFFLERESGRLWLNEINTLPGFTSISMYPRLWAEEGVALPELVSRLVDLGLSRFAERSRNRKTYEGR